jgi:hypothetical protein
MHIAPRRPRHTPAGHPIPPEAWPTCLLIVAVAVLVAVLGGVPAP